MILFIFFDVETILDKLRKVWGDYLDGEITPESAAEQLFTEDGKYNRKGEIYNGRANITKFLEEFRQANHTKVEDAKFEKCSEGQNCSWKISFTRDNESLVLEIKINEDLELMEMAMLANDKGIRN